MDTVLEPLCGNSDSEHEPQGSEGYPSSVFLEALFIVESMNQTRWSSLTAVILLSALTLMPASQAKDVLVVPTLPQDGLSQNPVSQPQEDVQMSPSSPAIFAEIEASGLTDLVSDPASSPVKVGSVQSASRAVSEGDGVALVVPHEYNQQRAATLYVRNIPVLTFLDRQGQPVYKDVATDSASSSPLTTAIEADKNLADPSVRKPASESVLGESDTDEMDPVWQASRVAAGINELSRQLSDTEITVRWDSDRVSYIVSQGDTEIASVNLYTILPDTTGNWEEDALQVTNRLRRLLHQDPPLRELEHSRIPPAESIVAVVSRQILNGWASWYGPGFHGGHSASGEAFNPKAMTAAHLTLPFGTQVRVTNLNNGRSVVVRINDRGPYGGGRILDVSQGAASALGMIESGVVRVRVDVLGSP